MTTAYLRTALHVDQTSRPAARAAFGNGGGAIGHVDTT
jgi:hypothetical protein